MGAQGRQSEPGKNSEGICGKLLQKHVEALEETYRLFYYYQESFEGFLERMEKARRIFFFGISDSQLIAQEAGISS